MKLLSYDSSKSRKEYLVLTCGPPSLNAAVPNAKGEDGMSCSEDDSSGDEENQTVSLKMTWKTGSLHSFQSPQPLIKCGAFCVFNSLIIACFVLLYIQVTISDRNRPRKKRKLDKKSKGKDWVLRKKEQLRRKGSSVPADTKYTARKRKSRF